MKIIWFDSNGPKLPYPLTTKAFEKLSKVEKELSAEIIDIGEAFPGWFVFDNCVEDGLDIALLCLGNHLEKNPKENVMVICKSTISIGSYYVFFVRDEEHQCDLDVNMSTEIIEILTGLYRDELTAFITGSKQ